MARLYEIGKFVSTVLHGATGFLQREFKYRRAQVKGGKVTGFSWPEEVLVTI
jgi:hypothetical protein